MMSTSERARVFSTVAGTHIQADRSGEELHTLAYLAAEFTAAPSTAPAATPAATPPQLGPPL